MPIPYNLSQDFEGFYSFTTDFGLRYSLFLIDTTEQFGLDQGHGCVLYHFGLTLESIAGENERKAYDERIEATVLDFVSTTLINNKNCIGMQRHPQEIKKEQEQGCSSAGTDEAKNSYPRLKNLIEEQRRTNMPFC